MNDRPATAQVNEPVLESSLVVIRSTPRPPSLDRLRAQTPARILTGRAGAAYCTATWLKLRADHAAARDTVCTELDMEKDLGSALIARWKLFEVSTNAQTKQEFLLHPELGRSLSIHARSALAERCPPSSDFQIAIADGLSTTAVRLQVPALLPLLVSQAQQLGWQVGQPFVVRHGRVGLLNDIGEILKPMVVVLLIGERPGLASADSLSAYLAFRPHRGHDDAQRNLISNIHERGVPPLQAAPRIINLASQMIQLKTSGITIKEWILAGPPNRDVLEG
jgi:ethanolamine ammonia-lyase small subunit